MHQHRAHAPFVPFVCKVPLAAYGVAAAAVPTDGDNDGSNTAYGPLQIDCASDICSTPLLSFMRAPQT